MRNNLFELEQIIGGTKKFVDANNTVMVTPEIATELLTLNKVNRKISNYHIQELALQITRGLWMSNGESIKISSDGQLIDGQHRLRAIIKSGIPIPLMITIVDSDDAFLTIDSGKRRSVNDRLSINDIKNRYPFTV